MESRPPGRGLSTKFHTSFSTVQHGLFYDPSRRHGFEPAKRLDSARASAWSMRVHAPLSISLSTHTLEASSLNPFCIARRNVLIDKKERRGGEGEKKARSQQAHSVHFTRTQVFEKKTLATHRNRCLGPWHISPTVQ